MMKTEQLQTERWVSHQGLNSLQHAVGNVHPENTNQKFFINAWESDCPRTHAIFLP